MGVGMPSAAHLQHRHGLLQRTFLAPQPSIGLDTFNQQEQHRAAPDERTHRCSSSSSCEIFRALTSALFCAAFSLRSSFATYSGMLCSAARWEAIESADSAPAVMPPPTPSATDIAVGAGEPVPRATLAARKGFSCDRRADSRTGKEAHQNCVFGIQHICIRTGSSCINCHCWILLAEFRSSGPLPFEAVGDASISCRRALPR